MCDPLTIAGLALTAGATVANTVANNQVQAARNDALAAERIRQDALNREAEAINATSQDRYDDFEGQQAQEAVKLGDYFAGQTTEEPTTAEALPTSTSNITVQEEAKQRGKARQFTDASGQALGELRSFGDLLGGIGRLQARDANLVGQIGSFKQGSSGIVPYELEQAGQAGDGMKLFGDLLGGAGSVATTAGLSGGNLFGFGAPTAAAANVATVGAKVAPIPAIASPTLRLGNLYGGGR